MIHWERKYNEKWLEASVLGSIWGSFEIIVGSILHNLKLPLSGTLLASFVVVLMIGYGMQSSKNGIFWRAGIIAALMKSVSPSAVLLGPMTAIILEGFLMEIGLLLFGRNFFAYLFSGILVLYSVIIHKIVALLLLYGFNIVKITRNFYYFILKQLKINGLSFYQALFLLSLLYVIIGIFSATVGYIIGKRALRVRKNNGLKLQLKKILQENPDDKRFALILLLFHILFLILIIRSLHYSLLIGSLISFVYIVFCLIRYKGSFRRFRRTGLWLQLLIIFLISAFFFNGSGIFNIAGIKEGIAMVLRSIVVIVSFVGISHELSSPLVKLILYKNGFSQVYTSLSLAFSALPIISANFKNKEFFKHPLEHISGLLALNTLYDDFIKILNRRKLFVITGEVDSGKTALLHKVINLLQIENIGICGIVSVSDEREKFVYYVKDISSGISTVLCTQKKIENAIKIGRYYFYSEGLSFGSQVLLKCKDSNLVIVDEVGPLELRNKGWAKALQFLFAQSNAIQIWTIRKKLVYDVLKHYNIAEAFIFEVGKDKPEQIIYEIKKAVKSLESEMVMV